MAIILFGSASTSPGEAQTATLSRTSLEDAVSLFSPGETYYNNAENWKAVICVMKSGRQQIRLKFGQNEDVTDFVTSLFVMLDQFEVVSVTLQDFDGGKFILPMTPEERTAMSMGVVPYIDPIFKSTWTSSGADSATFAITSTDQFNISVNGGEPVTTTLGDTSVTVTLPTVGDNQVWIDTTTDPAHKYEKLYISTKTLLTSVESLGDCGWTNMNSAFRDCPNLASVAGGDTSAVTDMREMFRGTTVLTSLDISTFVTSAVTDMREMFSGATGLISLIFPETYTTASVINMYKMFYGTTGLTSLDLSSFDTIFNATVDARSMFEGSITLGVLDLSGCSFLLDANIIGIFNNTPDPLALTVNTQDDANTIGGLGYTNVVVTVEP